MLAVLLLYKISRNLVESKPFKTSCKFIFFQIRIDFLKKSCNFNSMSLGSHMQIRYNPSQNYVDTCAKIRTQRLFMKK